MAKEGRAYFLMNTFTFEQLEFYSKQFKAKHILSLLLQLLSCFPFRFCFSWQMKPRQILKQRLWETALRPWYGGGAGVWGQSRPWRTRTFLAPLFRKCLEFTGTQCSTLCLETYFHLSPSVDTKNPFFAKGQSQEQRINVSGVKRLHFHP